MADFLIVCVNRLESDSGHGHIRRVGVQPLSGGDQSVVKVKHVRRQIKRNRNRFFSEAPGVERAEVSVFRCSTCNRGSIRTIDDDLNDRNLAVKESCG
jgi:hypothetical protein